MQLRSCLLSDLRTGVRMRPIEEIESFKSRRRGQAGLERQHPRNHHLTFTFTSNEHWCHSGSDPPENSIRVGNDPTSADPIRDLIVRRSAGASGQSRIISIRK